MQIITVNHWLDPDFVDRDGGDYHLGPDSGAIDRAIPDSLVTDIDGDRRPPIGSAAHIGADEVLKAIYLPLVLRNA